MKHVMFAVLLCVVSSPGCALEYQSPDLNSLVCDYPVLKAPETPGLLLKKGDRLAICGDSITEQKMYSRIVETYLTVCVPQLQVSVRQFGWGGETAPQFLARMQDDCLRFDPTIATTSYGMNDHHYLPYKDEYGKEYREAMSGIVKLFKDHNTRVIIGSPGCIGKKPAWQKDPTFTNRDLNLNLLQLRNIGLQLATEQGTGFADIYCPMLEGSFKALERYGVDFHVTGEDGVHPDWAGHLIMAYAFLKAMGLDGQIGTITMDLKADTATATEGHTVLGCSGSSVQLESRRYPYCADGSVEAQNTVRAGMTLVPFNEHLNRLMLIVKNTSAKTYKVSWGQWEKTYTAKQLNEGVNLADDFAVNPFSESFNAVSEAVRIKQEYETQQIKYMFHGSEGKADMDMTVTLTEKARKRLTDEIAGKFQPVRHTITLTAL